MSDNSDSTDAQGALIHDLLRRVIDIASASAEANTAAASSLTSVRGELESQRSDLNALKVTVHELCVEISNMRQQRQNEIDSHIAETKAQSQVRAKRLEVVKGALSKILDPQTIFIVLTILGSAFGIKMTMQSTTTVPVIITEDADELDDESTQPEPEGLMRQTPTR